MTERPAVAGSADAAAERDVLLATNLHVPGPRPGFVPRPRLADRLDEGRGRGLVLVCATAGSGKTALLADWARWAPPPPPSFEPLVTALSNDLTAGSEAGEVPLVLDDYHLVGSQPVHTSVGFLLEHLPPGCTRCWLAAPIRRWRWRGCGLADSWLSCGPPSCGSPPTRQRPCCVRRPVLTCPTRRWPRWRPAPRGWAAGLQLAGLSLRGQEDVAGFVAAFTGSHR